MLHTSSNRLLLSDQDKGCTPSVARSLPLPLGPALLNLWTELLRQRHVSSCLASFQVGILRFVRWQLSVSIPIPGGYLANPFGTYDYGLILSLYVQYSVNYFFFIKLNYDHNQPVSIVKLLHNKNSDISSQLPKTSFIHKVSSAHFFLASRLLNITLILSSLFRPGYPAVMESFPQGPTPKV